MRDLRSFDVKSSLVNTKAIRGVLWKRSVGKEVSHLNHVAKPSGSGPLLATDLSPLKRGGSHDFLFVLGNGDSVNELDREDFAFIGRHTSIGLNAWPLHPFLPSVYSFELWSEDLDRESSEFSVLLKMALERSRSVPTPLLLLRPRSSQMAQLGRLGADIPGLRFLTYGRANVPYVSLKALDREISRSLGYLKINRLENYVLLDNGASVARMAAWAVVNGFRHIVLVGVDLNRKEYFWYNDKFVSSSGDYTQSCRRAAGEGQGTLSVANRPFSMLDFLPSLDRVARKDFGSKVLVASKNSRLAEVLEIFCF
jgi:hypothetical protein